MLITAKRKDQSMAWWDKQENIDMLVHIANDLDKQYPDQKIVGVGHSPSWLVHTVAQIRMNEGRKHNTTLVPFTGSFWGNSKAEMNDDKTHTIVTYQHSRYSPVPEQETLKTCFNALSSRITNALAPVPENKIILVDLIVSGDSFVSFADALAEQGHPALRNAFDQYYQAHIYKPFFDGGDATFKLVDGQGATRLSFDGHAQGRDAAYFLNGISGGKGLWSTKNSPHTEKTCGRFMPAFDIRSNDRPFHLGLNNREDLKNIHKRIVSTVRQMDRDDVIARMQESRENFNKKMPRTLNNWYYRGPTTHG